MASKDHYVELESPEFSLAHSPEAEIHSYENLGQTNEYASQATIGSSFLSVYVDNSGASSPPSSPPPLPPRSAQSSAKSTRSSVKNPFGSAHKKTVGSAHKKTPGSARRKENFHPDPVYIRDSVQLIKCTPRKELVDDRPRPVTFVTAKVDQQRTGY